MSNSIYQINKGVNKSIEFHGLKAQYIWYFGGMAVCLLLLFVVLYMIGVYAIVCLCVLIPIGCFLGSYLFKMSKKYGEHGLMKELARRRIPQVVKSGTRRIYYFKKTSKVLWKKPRF